MSSDIQIIHSDGLRVDTRTLAPKLDIRHRNIIQNIRSYATEFEELGTVPFQTEARLAGQHGGGDIVFALLNEDQCYFLLTLSRNSPLVVKAKLSLTKAFKAARQTLDQVTLARLEGKKARRVETDAIKRLVDYATQQGSKSAEKYYMSVTKMTHDLLGFESGQRDKMTKDQLQQLPMAELMVDITIRNGIAMGLEYKDIYQLAKERVKHLVPAIQVKLGEARLTC
jgi:phage regulator Rha-like protein